ncbi:hypothetical protein FS842_005927 [Serendipita sp. 407]|nr:hypothetical protein FS842_005927 [Serendipita sp. 407]
MAEASTSSTGQPSPNVLDELPPPELHETELGFSDDYDSSDDSDALSDAAIPNPDDMDISKVDEEEEEAPPFPLFNIWTMPNARIPIPPYKEMSLACRFVPTDQWLTTRVDRTWTVGQVKHHMLTKLWEGRRYQLSIPRVVPPPPRERTLSQEGLGITSITSSNYSSVLFAPGLGDHHNYAASSLYRSSNTIDTVINGSVPSLVPSTAAPDSPDGSSPPRQLSRSISSERLRGRSPSSTSSRGRARSLGPGGKRPLSQATESVLGDLQREEAMDRLYERMEASFRMKVHRAAKNYRLVSFSNGNILDDKDPLSFYSLKPFELLEIQPAARCVRLARPTYLEPYFESDTMVRVRAGAEKHGIEFIRRLRQIQKEDRVRSEIAKSMAAIGMEGGKNQPGNEWGTGLSAVTKQKNLEQRREEEKRRILLELAKKEEEKRKRRERKEQEAEKWKFRKMVVEGHDLNIWRDPVHDTFPEQSWDLRRVIEVQIPRPEPEKTVSSTQVAYAALAASSNLQSVSTRAPDKTKPAKSKVPDHILDQPTLHIRFSIPLGSVYASLNPAAAAALHAARLKRIAKTNPGSSYLAESLASLGAASTRRLDSTDPYNQGIGFGTSTLEGAGTATLVLRLPNEKIREHLCRIIHRSAGRYPLATKHRRALAFEPVVDLIPVPDPDPERTKAHGAPFPDWRARILKKAIAAGRSGFLSSPAWSAAFNEATGLYMRPPGLSDELDVKGKGKAGSGAFLFDALSEGGYDDDDDDCASLASDTEWEGWRRELEMDLPPKALSSILSVSDATPKAGPSLSVLKEESVIALVPSPTSALPGGILADVVQEDVRVHTDEEDEAPVVAQRRRVPARRGSLKLARKIVVDGVAGKGLIMPRTNAYASWNSFTSTSSSITSSFQSHEEYRLGEGSDTAANRRPRLPPLVVGQGLSGTTRTSGTLSRAKSATVFSSRQNVPLPVASVSAPLSAAFDNIDGTWKGGSPHQHPQHHQHQHHHSDSHQHHHRHHSDVDEYVEPQEDLLTLDPDVMLPGLGGGLGNPAMFPPFADLGTTVTTITSGRNAMANGSSTKKLSLKKRSLGSLRNTTSWLSRSFRSTDESMPPPHSTSLPMEPSGQAPLPEHPVRRGSGSLLARGLSGSSRR